MRENEKELKTWLEELPLGNWRKIPEALTALGLPARALELKIGPSASSNCYATCVPVPHWSVRFWLSLK